MPHFITPSAGMQAADGGAIARWLRALLAALRARADRARQAAAERETLRILEALGPEQLYDIGLRDGDVRRLRRGSDPRL